MPKRFLGYSENNVVTQKQESPNREEAFILHIEDLIKNMGIKRELDAKYPKLFGYTITRNGFHRSQTEKVINGAALDLG